jgi:redox-regulated HSP33 family molecular chaperone
MSNRLEREFPAHRWQAVPPIRREDLPHEVIEHYLARGHQLRSEAFGRAGRRVVAAAGGVLAQIVPFFHGAAHGIAKRPAEHDCRCAGPRGA